MVASKGSLPDFVSGFPASIIPDKIYPTVTRLSLTIVTAMSGWKILIKISITQKKNPNNLV